MSEAIARFASFLQLSDSALTPRVIYSGADRVVYNGCYDGLLSKFERYLAVYLVRISPRSFRLFWQYQWHARMHFRGWPFGGASDDCRRQTRGIALSGFPS